MTDEQPLVGGNVGAVVRIGDTVRREAGPWTPAVHGLLRHLEAVGFPYAPRVVGLDRSGREILTYLAGDTVGDTEPWPAWAWSSRSLVALGGIVREYHDTVRDYRPAGELTWRFGTRALQPDEIICHNDLAPYNLVHRDGRIVGVIDWDIAGPGRPEIDLAQTACTAVPLTDPETAAALGAPGDLVRRLRLLGEAYGLDDLPGFVDVIVEHARGVAGTVRRMAKAGDPGFRRLAAGGHLERMDRNARWIEAHAPQWQRQLR